MEVPELGQKLGLEDGKVSAHGSLALGYRVATLLI